MPDTVEPFFGLRIPTTCPDVPGDLLDPRGQWADPARYDAQARQLAHRMREAFQPFASTVSADILAAGPPAGA